MRRYEQPYLEELQDQDELKYTRFLKSHMVNEHAVRIREIQLRRDGVAGKEKTAVKYECKFYSFL